MKSNFLHSLHALVLKGKYSDALALLSQIEPEDVSFEFVRLVSEIRSLVYQRAQLDGLNSLMQHAQWVNASVAQGLVANLLQDKKYSHPLRLERYGYSVGSQNEEDGMLAEVFNRIGVLSGTFFEFGVGTGLQNITLHSLLRGWSGAWIEIHPGKADFIRDKFSVELAAERLRLGTKPVTAENIDVLSEELGVPEEIDLLSIDIDGNDYHVFEAMTRVRARVVVLEYNPLYPPPLRIVMSYEPNYAFNPSTYMGSSLQSISELAEAKGYQLVGCSISGVNAIFVRKELAAGKFFEPGDPITLYNSPRYQLSFSGGFGWGPKSTFSSFDRR